jgi:hypothetical protein
MRLGQTQYQLWHVHGQCLELLASSPSEHIAFNQHQAIAEEVAKLGVDLPTGATVQLLVDSKWMPLSLLATGRSPLSGAQIQALARHRFVAMFGEHAQSWNAQTNYVSGDTHTLAFACPDALLASVRQSQIPIEGIQPTFCWAWNQAWRRQARKTDQWFVLAEHDRSVMARITNGRLVALQSAGPVLTSPTELAAALPVYALRCGLVETEHAALGISLEPRPDMTLVSPVQGIRWHAMSAVEVQA